MGYAILVSLDLLLTIIVCVHIVSPLTNLKTIGVTFLILPPACTVFAPIFGILGAFAGSPTLLLLQSSCNCASVLVSYPLTLVLMFHNSDEALYIAVVVLLWFNKIAISYFGAKVRQHWLNPGFSKNFDKIQDRFRSLIQA